MQLKHFSLIFSVRVIFSLKIPNAIGSFLMKDKCWIMPVLWG